MRPDAFIERFFTVLISGDRVGARQVVDQMIDTELPAQQIYSQLFWPTLEHIQKLHRADQISQLAHNYATRLIRSLAEQMQLRLEALPRNGQKVMLVCGQEQSEEMGAQIVADLLESQGYEVYFAGGGIANDEIVEQLGILQPKRLVIFGAVAQTVPQTRLLIDRLHEMAVCPDIQIAVGGGIFNRADGLCEEIGADVWARDPEELVQVIVQQPDRRMAPDQRTVGRKRRPQRDAA